MTCYHALLMTMTLNAYLFVHLYLSDYFVLSFHDVHDVLLPCNIAISAIKMIRYDMIWYDTLTIILPNDSTIPKPPQSHLNQWISLLSLFSSPKLSPPARPVASVHPQPRFQPSSLYSVLSDQIFLFFLANPSWWLITFWSFYFLFFSLFSFLIWLAWKVPDRTRLFCSCPVLVLVSVLCCAVLCFLIILTKMMRFFVFCIVLTNHLGHTPGLYFILSDFLTACVYTFISSFSSHSSSSYVFG